MSNTQKTTGKISIETIALDDRTTYSVKGQKGSFEVTCKDDGTLLVTSSAPTMMLAIGGRGEDDKINAHFTDKHCKSNAEAISNILELLMVISE